MLNVLVRKLFVFERNMSKDLSYGIASDLHINVVPPLLVLEVGDQGHFIFIRYYFELVSCKWARLLGFHEDA